MSDVPATVPTYVASAPKLDGDLSDPAWQQAAKTEDFQLLGGAGAATQRTIVHVCYTRSALYIAFECFEDQMDHLVAAQTADEAAVWQDDSVELFIAPYTVADEGKTHHFAVSVTGAKTHIQGDYSLRDTHWRAAVRKLKDRWVAEIEIPYSVLGRLGSEREMLASQLLPK